MTSRELFSQFNKRAKSLIGKLKGILDSQGEDHIILDVQGVGYLVYCPARTLQDLSVGEAAALLIETHVREDMIRLYGFLSEAEREWFKLLQSVQGVGAKVALNLLSLLKPQELSLAIAAGDKAVIGRGPGIGPKLAARLVTELKDKVPVLSSSAFLNQGMNQEANVYQLQNLKSQDQTIPDAISALVNLGYGQLQASVAVSSVLKIKSQDETLETKTLIKLALKEMAGT